MICLRSRMDYLREAMPFDSVQVVMSLGLVKTGAVATLGRWAQNAPLGGRRRRLAVLCFVVAAVSPFLPDVDLDYRRADPFSGRSHGFGVGVEEIGVAGGVGSAPVSIVDRAQPPSGPFKPNLPFNLALGLAFVGHHVARAAAEAHHRDHEAGVAERALGHAACGRRLGLGLCRGRVSAGRRIGRRLLPGRLGLGGRRLLRRLDRHVARRFGRRRRLAVAG